MKPPYLLSFVAIASLAVCSNNASAQLVDCNVFLQGKYVEIGISASGAYGSSAVAPAGYHGNSAGSQYLACSTTSLTGSLGFVADPAMDGWAVGTPPYYGDYFLPGTPFEGWAIEINGGARSDAFNTDASGFTNGLTGTNTSYVASGSTVSGIWTGSLDSLNIQQVTTLDTNNLYFTVTVTLTNTSSAPMNNIYYLRSQDPDNDEVQSGNYATNNKIQYQEPSALHTAVVTATGTVDTIAYTALGTADSNAKCFIYSNWAPYPAASVSIASMYNETATGLGTSYYAVGASSIDQDIAIGLAFFVPHLSGVDSATDSVGRATSAAGLHPANSARFTYFFAFSRSATDSAINATTAVIDTTTLSIKNINTTTAISVYPNPSKDIINITSLTTTDQLALYDMMGRVVTQNWKINTTGTNTFFMGNVPMGAYILMVTDSNGAVVARLPLRKL